MDRTCIKDGPCLTLHDSSPVGARWESEARKTQNNMEENHGKGKVGAGMEIMGTSKGHHMGQNKMTLHGGLMCR